MPASDPVVIAGAARTAMGGFRAARPGVPATRLGYAAIGEATALAVEFV